MKLKINKQEILENAFNDNALAGARANNNRQMLIVGETNPDYVATMGKISTDSGMYEPNANIGKVLTSMMKNETADDIQNRIDMSGAQLNKFANDGMNSDHIASMGKQQTNAGVYDPNVSSEEVTEKFMPGMLDFIKKASE